MGLSDNRPIGHRPQARDYCETRNAALRLITVDSRKRRGDGDGNRHVHVPHTK